MKGLPKRDKGREGRAEERGTPEGEGRGREEPVGKGHGEGGQKGTGKGGGGRALRLRRWRRSRGGDGHRATKK